MNGWMHGYKHACTDACKHIVRDGCMDGGMYVGPIYMDVCMEEEDGWMDGERDA